MLKTRYLKKFYNINVLPFHEQYKIGNIGIKGFPSKNVSAAQSYLQWDLVLAISGISVQHPATQSFRYDCKSETFESLTYSCPTDSS